ncbi:hypothetical protein ES332_D02G227000v1 [Gossypium tomentosum]|uniref:Uncharacterized protein n=1 Tax=Gossypium tomentosum TaxID=34277 RepID=A0A5D2M0T6_GOSTO|nr:hypothetical protein ES332_D02G227000v1 [Gossypium tomentosum]
MPIKRLAILLWWLYYMQTIITSSFVTPILSFDASSCTISEVEGLGLGLVNWLYIYKILDVWKILISVLVILFFFLLKNFKFLEVGYFVFQYSNSINYKERVTTEEVGAYWSTYDSILGTSLIQRFPSYLIISFRHEG